MYVNILYKADIAELPPLITLAQTLIEKGYQVRILSGACQTRLRAILESDGVKVHTLMREFVPPRTKPAVALHMARYRRWLEHKLADAPAEAVDWIGSVDTAIALYGRRTNRRWVLQVHELYDKFPVYRAFLSKLVQQASAVVCPDRIRAAILRSWYSLPYTPFVIHNKPAHHPRRRGLVSEDRGTPHVDRLIAARDSGVRIALYQGHIGGDRNITAYAKAFAQRQGDWMFVAMGPVHGAGLNRLLEVNPHMLHIPYVVPPDHLAITSMADVGIIRYGHASLNNVFCAPNKLWEYTGFGIPFLGDRIPGLEQWLMKYPAGICTDETVDAILDAADRITNDYDSFSKAAERLFDSISVSDEVGRVLEFLKCHA